jgi:hypothetical protein
VPNSSPQPDKSTGPTPPGQDRGETRTPRDRRAGRAANLTPAQKQAFAQLGRIITWFSGCVFAAFGLTLAPLPWSVLGVVLVVAATGLGVVGIVRARRLPGGGPVATSFGIGLAFTALLLAYCALLAMQWPAQWHYQRCQHRALTEAARDACLVDYQRDSQAIVNRLTRGLG